MPDRAVVAQKHRDHCQRMLNQSAGMKGPEWDIARESWQRCLADAEQERLASRAIVSLSDDRQWLVVLCPDRPFWLLHKWDRRWGGYEEYDGNLVGDTGQDAHQVLAEWMEGIGE